MTAVRKWSNVGRELVGSCCACAFLPQVQGKTLITKPQDRVNFKCDGKWDVSVQEGERAMYKEMMTNDFIGKPAQAGDGFKDGVTCPCPHGKDFDWAAYTGKEFKQCLNEDPHCVFEMRLPTVVAKAKAFFA